MLTCPLQVIKRMTTARLGWQELRLMVLRLVMASWVLDMMIRPLQMFPTVADVLNRSRRLTIISM